MNDTEDRKKRKKLSRNGWMAKLYYFVWGKKPNFMGYCPMFWSTWICILLAPFIALGKGLEYLCTTLGEIWCHCFPEKEEARTFEYDESGEIIKHRWPKPSFREIVQLFEAVQKAGSLNYEVVYNYDIDHDTYAWARQNAKSWESHYETAKQAWEREIREEKIRAERSAALAKRREAIVNFLRIFVKPALALSAVTGAYAIYKTLFFVCGLFTFAEFVSALISIGFGLAFLLVLALVATFLAKLVKLFIEYCDAKEVKRSKTPRKPRKPHLFDKLIKFIKETCAFAKDTVVMTYKKECPLIEWTDDETGPIERNPSYKG